MIGVMTRFYMLCNEVQCLHSAYTRRTSLQGILRDPVYRREVANLVDIEETRILTEGNCHYYLVWLKPGANRDSVFALNPK